MDTCPPCHTTPAHRPRLSRQETAVLRALAWYGNNADIGAALHLSPATVGTLLGRVRRKYALAGRAVPNQVLLVRAGLLDRVICPHHLLGAHQEHCAGEATCPNCVDAQ